MKGLANDRTIAWNRVAVDRETMKALNRRSDWKGLLQAGGHLGLIALTGTAAWYAYTNDRFFLLLPILFFYGTFYIFLLNATHELSHNTVFKTKFLNGLFLRIFCFLGWRNHHLFWASHAEHHKYTLHPPDDLEVVLPQDLNLRGFLKTVLLDVWKLFDTLKTHIRLSFGKLEGEWEHHLFPSSDVEKRRRLFNWSRFLLVGHAAIIGVSIYFELWLLPILTTFGSFYAGWLRYLCNATQHAGLKDDVSDFRLCCRTVILSPLIRFLYWHMNYHIEHHMYAAVPCYNLGKLHKAIRHDLPHCPRGLSEAWKEIIAILKRQKIEPEYQHVPELPTHAVV